MPKASKSAADAPVDPNKLVRQRAGSYRTADDRFEVRQAALGWFLIDSSVTDQLGQELTRGPFATLAAVGDELPEARRTTIKSLPIPKRAKPAVAKSGASAAKQPARKVAPAKPPPQTWIDRLPAREATAVRRLIKALELEEIPDAEALVKAARRSGDPVVATRVLEKRLDALIADVPAGESAASRRLVQRVAELLTSGGTTLFDPLPGWALVEVEPGAKPPDRRIVVRPSPKRR